ncbi:uncharacterized protein LOC128745280 [Sabethes cyaneus]|uniref:uncharacterized protein LOC128745280 n=1 Tax=Sabethes cyaneus TaxID=53552 RepID=UPI00237D9E5D|nr:uncharacterized protein LOC128745280 [Sabethes cyaneus]
MESTGECAICLEAMPPSALRLQQCAHRFHADCINRWLSVRNRCPICRIVTTEGMPLNATRAEVDYSDEENQFDDSFTASSVEDEDYMEYDSDCLEEGDTGSYEGSDSGGVPDDANWDISEPEADDLLDDANWDVNWEDDNESEDVRLEEEAVLDDAGWDDNEIEDILVDYDPNEEDEPLVEEWLDFYEEE